MSEKLTATERDFLRESVSRPIAIAANPKTCRAILALLNERDELELERDGERETRRSFEFRLNQATKAGTPYSVEQDGINALHLRVADLERENEQLRRLGSKQRDEIETLNDMADAVECLRDIGRLVGCGHVDDADGRRQLVNCVDQAITGEPT